MLARNGLKILTLCVACLIINVRCSELYVDELSKEFTGELKQMISDRLDNKLSNATIIEKFTRFIRKMNETYTDLFEIPKKRMGSWDYLDFVMDMEEVCVVFQRFADSIHKNDLSLKYNDTYLKIEGLINDEFFKSFADDLKNFTSICKLKATERQIYYRLHVAMVLTDLKHLLLRLFRDLIQFDKTNEYMYLSEVDNHARRTREIARITSQLMLSAPNYYANCHLRTYTAKDYLRITGFLQGYILEQRELHQDGTCTNKCEYYKDTKPHKCHETFWCNEPKRCNGKLRDCRTIREDALVCADPATSSHRRYVSVDSTEPCKHSYYLSSEDPCSLCFCICDTSNKQAKDGLRIFNMRASVANVYENKVVIGVQFVQHNDMIHLQVQEGTLTKRGLISRHEMRWVPLANHTTLDNNVQVNQDYAIISYDKRRITLGDVIAGEGEVLIGVRFKRSHDNQLTLEGKFCEYNYATGALKNPYYNSFWLDNSESSKQQIVMQSKMLPTNCEAKDTIKLTNGFVEFDVSDRETDAAQEILPMFDAQPLNLTYPTPLSGIGLYYRAAKNCGGFITPKIFTSNQR